MVGKIKSMNPGAILKRGFRILLFGLGYYTLCNDISTLLGLKEYIDFSGSDRYITILAITIVFVILELFPKKEKGKDQHHDDMA